MNPLVDIERTGAAGRACILRFADGTTRRTSFAAARALELVPGPATEAERVLGALETREPHDARERALRLLSHRERSSLELGKRLSEDGYPPEVVRSVIGDLERAGLVDDARFAEAWARSRILAGRGPRLVLRELADKGIDPDTARHAVSEALADDDEETLAARLVAGHSIDDRKDRERALRRLLARGFSPAAALKALEHTGAEGLREGVDDPP